ncbi:glycosyltransferase family 2 protein [Candidatus Borrarchaeum sp.]|uniref:glycosyltransferase family 2 protein n=1 Tax=Candidatus Borrarchaeum sp. TaxID=2846742 RepID=UPI00257C05FB|nr:glycosyltransferase family 2 protein [Candidatus Borrarchaeum sp.]
MDKDMASIIILTKNGEKTIGKCLKGIFSQKTTRSFEVIVIDSGSTDRTQQIVKNYPVKVITIPPERFSHSRTRNFGAYLAKGNFLVYITQDAQPSSRKWLETLIKHFQDPEVIAVFGRQIPRKNCHPSEKRALLRRYPKKFAVYREKDICPFSDVNSTIRKDIWEKYPYNVEVSIAEDLEWANATLRHLTGKIIIYDPKAAVYHSHNYEFRELLVKMLRVGGHQRLIFQVKLTPKKFITSLLSAIKFWMVDVFEDILFTVEERNTKWLFVIPLYSFIKTFGKLLGIYLTSFTSPKSWR